MVKQTAKKKIGTLDSIKNKLHLNFIGLTCGLLFFCLSFTPSLLARGYGVQGFAAGLSFATGYGLGVLAVHFYHKLPRKYRWSLSTRNKQIILSILGVLCVVFMAAGSRWQAEIRELTGASPAESTYYLKTIIIAALLSALLIWMARGMHRLGVYFGRKLDRHVPRKVSVYGGGLLAAVVIIFLINGVLISSVMGVINYSFGLKNGGTPAGVYQPQDGLFSGSPSSAIDWNTLGEKGREFVGTAPSQNAIESFAGEGNAKQPSRLYAGLKSADTTKDQVDLLIKELDRTEASNRKAILIAIPTGSGGVNAKSVQSVEYLHGGDTTTLAIQYSYLPSWLSFLTDQDKARDAGKQLTDGVYNWWRHLDPDNRPKLLMYGESLGTFGADGAFSGAEDIYARMDGVLLVGPPHANHLWSGIVANRDAGTPEVLPTYQEGEAVRFSNGQGTAFAQPTTTAWTTTSRVGFVQHASDPVIWWSLSLAWSKPDWLREPRGSDVLPNIRWYPFVTEWQVALDLPFAFGASPGHGHNYGNALSENWTAILDIELGPEKATQLDDIISKVKG